MPSSAALLNIACEIEASTIPALSVRQPWADALIYGGKPVENRPKRGRHRGWTMIHASAGMTGLEATQFNRFCEDRGLSRDWQARLNPFVRRGGIIGLVRISDCVDGHPSPWWIGPHAFVCEEPIGLATLIECKGTVFPLFWEPELAIRSAVATRYAANIPRLDNARHQRDLFAPGN